jgi:DNA-binding FadR family transcriptional regulator
MSEYTKADSHMPALSSLTAANTGATDIASRLQSEILNGGFTFGDRLPAERRLASHFGISRSTVREALRQLEEKRLVSRRVGSGTFVNYRAPTEHDEIAEATSPLELIEVRLALEPHMVRLAVQNATARNLDQLGRALDLVESATHDRVSFSAADEAFHLRLAECSSNPLMLWLYRSVNEVRGHNQWGWMRDNILTPERIGEYNLLHRQIYEAVASRDMEGAVAAINKHLEVARADLLGIKKR